MILLEVTIREFKVRVRLTEQGHAMFTSPSLTWERQYADEEQAGEEIDRSLRAILAPPSLRMVHRAAIANLRETFGNAMNRRYWAEDYDREEDAANKNAAKK